MMNASDHLAMPSARSKEPEEEGALFFVSITFEGVDVADLFWFAVAIA